jgi:O2-independent ubiquinone biosynthesis protein UbiV
MTDTSRADLTLGPVYYLWDGPKWRDFYLRIADEAPVERVIIGETVCSKRQHFIEPHMADVIERLEAAGKQVVLSTLALVSLQRESLQIAEMAKDDTRLVEANDLSALGLLRGKPHTVGPLVNVYNAAAARFLSKGGAERICLPPELPLASIANIAADKPEAELEVFAFGRMPLAISARCAHARSKGRIKDNCLFVCGEEPDGLTINTLDGQSFLTLNGVQTVSYTCQSVINEMPDLAEAGISSFRLSPQDCDMVEVANIYRSALDREIDAEKSIEKLKLAYSAAPFSNGFLHAREGAAWVARARNTALHGAV